MKKTSARNPRRKSATMQPARPSLATHSRVVAAARSAVRQAIRAHKAEGTPIVIWRNGKVVTVPAREIKA
jgi:hypothetical protein